MKSNRTFLTNRYAVFAIGAIAGLVVGVVASRGPIIPAARASGESFTLTGTLAIPEKNNSLMRIEDKQTGVVCYMADRGGFFSCAQKK